MSGSPAIAASPLADAPSAFVRAHAESPVKWMPWGEAAFARAQAEKKPLYVIVGSFTQELARAMREQNFAREENAALLNEGFVCVVIDRDEHPDLAAYFQAYLGTVKQVQGWPLNLWLTPELKPFDGTTYLPPSDEWGKEGFPNAIKRVLAAWQGDPEAQRAKAEEAIAALAAAAPAASHPVDADEVNKLLAGGAAAWLATFDATNGGFGEPPRRLEPELLRFLLRTDDGGRAAALATLRAITASPVRDPLDGGFFRSAGDTAWRQPNLQKSFSDQARMVFALLDATKAGGDAGLPSAAQGAVRYALSLGAPGTGFAAAEDGTWEFMVPSYLWTVAELHAALGSTSSRELFDALGCTEEGNIPPDSYLGVDCRGKNLPRFAGPLEDSSALARARRIRAERPLPPRDSLATSGAHGLLLAALVCVDDTASRAAAPALAAFIQKELILADGRLRSAPGFTTAALPRDYAMVIDGLLTFAAAAKNESASTAALALLAKCDALFWDAASGRYFASALPLASGVAVRVVAPAPDAGEPASAESAMLLALVSHDVGDQARRAVLAAAIAAEVRDAAAPARGDQLLALQAFVRGKP